jgi:hypothetical protein
MTRAVAIALALTLSSAPIGNIVCAAWCDARSSSNGSPADVCHTEPAHSLFAVFVASDACTAFASTPFVREDTRRVAAPEVVSIDAAFLPMVFAGPGRYATGGVSEGTQPVPPNHAQMPVLRI